MHESVQKQINERNDCRHTHMTPSTNSKGTRTWSCVLSSAVVALVVVCASLKGSIWINRTWCYWCSSSCSGLKAFDVSPILPKNGSLGEAARLWLPEHMIRQQLMTKQRVRVEQYVDETQRSGIEWWWPHRKNPKDEPVPWYTYNSSDAAYLVPWSQSWMLDAEAMYDKADEGLIDLGVAMSVSELVSATYCNPSNLEHWNCTRCKGSFELERVIFDPIWDLLGFVGWSHDLDGIVISFRGTDSHSYYNWVENMRTWRTDLSLSYRGMPSQALVHGGFFYSYNASYLAGNVSEAVSNIIAKRGSHPRGAGGGSGRGWDQHSLSSREGTNDDVNRRQNMPTIFVSGHSLGGALATFCALEMKLVLGMEDVRVVTFGSPRVGNSVFADWYRETIPQNFRFTHNRDMIPSLPPTYMGFSHIAQEVWLVDVVPSRTLVGVCDGSGEDPKCHRGACRFGFCSSLTDHLLYLSEMYAPRPVGC